MKKKSIWNFYTVRDTRYMRGRDNHFSELRVRSVDGRGTR